MEIELQNQVSKLSKLMLRQVALGKGFEKAALSDLYSL